MVQIDDVKRISHEVVESHNARGYALVKLTEAQKDILRQFDRSVHEGGSRHSPQEQSWLDKVKSFFS